MRGFDEESLVAFGFGGGEPFSSLEVSSVPAQPGVYCVIRRAMQPPEFLEQSRGGWFKGRDPTVPSDVLRGRWVDGSPVVYIGQTTNLRTRLRQYRDFGSGRPVGHWGGRYIWQLADVNELRVFWKPTNENPRAEEIRLLVAFEEQHGRRPFANLVR